MNKVSANTRSIMLRAVCTALALVLGGSLFAAGALGLDGCGMKCCCQTSPVTMLPAAESQIRSPMGCCSGVPLSPCDLQPAQPFELPEIILAAGYVHLPIGGGTTAILADSYNDWLNRGGVFISQVLSPKFNSPPLYLQKLSFLI
ncbi:MAG: hypothetical protein HKO68_10835 [Desulfobacterales bacterium]|nr:hypothetical protein [Desulfobacterales bacterium]